MAGYRPADWHPLDLDKDPTPGDPQRVRTLAAQLHTFADDVSDALRLVKGMAGEDALLQWAGKSAEVFKEQFKDVPKNLKKLKKSYELCGDALADYWPKLERAQALADKALAKAKEAQSDLSSAKSRLSSADSWVTRATKEADKYKDDPTGSKSDGDKPDEGKVRAATRDVQSAKSAHTKAQSDATSAQNALDAAKKMAEDARKMRDDAAGEAKRKIDEASDAGIPNRHWWQDVGHWFEDNWDTIVTVCKVVVAVVGIIAMIIGGPILGAIVLIAALVVLADTLYKYSKGQASLWDVAFAALDCIPGGKGITSLGKLAKGLKEMRNLRGGMKAMSLAVRGLGKNARGMLAEGAEGAFNRLKSVVRSKGSDPVDMATGAMYLPQSDIELPGLLPLSFTRRVASDYRCGWWFGPSWASTLDERLEVDERGVVYVTEDGLLLAYPHPTGPQAPVMPEAGPRRPLTRHDDGGYRITDPLTGHTRHFARPAADGTCLLTRISDRNQHTITFDHDEHGTPLAIRHSGGYHLKLTTDEGRVTALSLAGAADDGTDVVVKRYGYTDGNLTETVNSSGLPLRFTYDDRLRVTSWTDTNNSRYAYSYDDRDRCIAEGGEAGHITITLDYDGTDPAWPDCRITTLTTAEGAVTRFVVNTNSQVLAEIDPLGNTTRTEYDEHHHVTSHVDALGHGIEFVNDELGRPVEVRHPDGSRTSVVYGALGLPTETVTQDGGRWSRTYDERGNGLTLTDPTGATSHFSYDEQGSLVECVDPLGATTRLLCNPAGLAITVIDPLGGHTVVKRDGFGRIVSETDPLGQTACWRWTTEGQLLSAAHPDGTTESWTYDAEGNCLSHTDAVGAVTRYEYTHFDLPSARFEPGGAYHRFEYDASLRLAKVTDGSGRTWEYMYDAAGNLIAETDFDNRLVRYERDPAGRLTARTSALGQVVGYTRDAMGRPIRINADGADTDFAYDLAGRLTDAVWSGGRLSRTYDAAGQLTEETINGRTLRLTYDAAGRLVRRRTPAGTDTVYAYDAAGRRISLSTAGHTVVSTHDAVGRETNRLWGSATRLALSWNSSDRPATQQVTGPNGAALPPQEYTWRADGALLATGEQHYTLDLAGRITHVRAAEWTEAYAYDTAGNQTTAAWPQTHAGSDAAGHREYVGSRLVAAGQMRYVHDGSGRLVERRRTRLSRKPDIWRYAWDAQDRLTEVTNPEGTVWRYAYDPLGRRIAKQRLSPGGKVLDETVFSWHEGILVEQSTALADAAVARSQTWEFDESGIEPLAQIERHVNLPDAARTTDMPQEEIDRRFYAIVTDIVGSPTALLDEHGDVVWRRTATLWGTTTWNADASAYTPLRFPGQYHDAETGHHYNLHRHYDPDTGRYLSPDPLGLTAAPNPQTYVHNPLTWLDPYGLSPYQPIRVRAGQQVKKGTPFEMSPPEREFVEKLLEKRTNLRVYRTHGKQAEGDFVIVDMTDKKNRVGWVVDHKMNADKVTKGNQFTNAARAAEAVGIPRGSFEIATGDTDKLLEILGRGRSEWNRS
ncbi:RHS repeat-associated core domain-containing protein [Streptomyces sp. NPDC013172]|uniref:RHS repeat-associated core domain-containing protein n=1 Tax=Streptomyces sp. NPDC013172 TaxID=3155009 RepID=UPI0033C3A962